VQKEIVLQFQKDFILASFVFFFFLDSKNIMAILSFSFLW
jgi:hypothetical protein